MIHYSYSIDAPARDSAAFRSLFAGIQGLQSIIVSPDYISVTFVLYEQGDIKEILQRAAEHKIGLHPIPKQVVSFKIAIDGMTCQSCEVAIEQKLKTISGVSSVDVDAKSGSARIVSQRSHELSELQRALGNGQYHVRPLGKNGTVKSELKKDRRPSGARLAGLVIITAIATLVLSKANLLTSSTTLEESVSFGAAFFIGLFAATSSCIAVSGGLLLSSAANWNERYGTLIGIARMQPIAFFIIGRLVSYGAFGYLIGALGTALTPSPLVTGALMVAAALFMILMGLDMLQLAPSWLNRFIPRMPKFISRSVIKKEQSHSPMMPFLMGAATFFLPCGFTQSLQLYALTTQSAPASALILFAFALGTAPSLAALGWASTSLKGKIGTLFFQASGVLVIMLGLLNIQNGFAAAGAPFLWPSFESRSTRATVEQDPNVAYDGSSQTIRMSAGLGGYTPSRVTIRAGLPTTWIIDGTNAQGCQSIFQAPQLGLKTFLEKGENKLTFTAPRPGTYGFSCSMGMYRGSIVVVPNT